MSSLRPIAVYVEEPTQGRFVWVLAERHGRSWRDMDRSDAPVASYKAAMADGLFALQSMVEDLDVGPRDDMPDVETKAVARRPRSETRDEPTRAPGPAKGFFGFGPVR